MEYEYPQDSIISDRNGFPRDSFPDYFPDSIRYVVKDSILFSKDSLEIPYWKLKEDDDFIFNRIWFSSCLYAAKEPILYNYYLGYDRYRLLWIRSFHLPIIITFSKQGRRAFLEIKKLSKHPQFIEGHIIGSFDEESGFVVDSIMKIDWSADFLINEIKEVPTVEWNKFRNLLESVDFYRRIPVGGSLGLDGSQWTIEVHHKNKYWFGNRWSGSYVRECGKFLVELSGLNEEIY